MTTILKGFAELTSQLLEELDLQPKIERGDVFWVKNSVLNFGDRSADRFHPAVVVRVKEQRVLVRVMTSKVKGHQRRGVLVNPMPQVRLHGRSLILTGNFALRWLPLRELDYNHYLSTLGTDILNQVDEAVTSANGRIHQQEPKGAGAGASRNGHDSKGPMSKTSDSLDRVLQIIFLRMDQVQGVRGLTHEIAAD